MKKLFNISILATFALLFSLTGCVSENILPDNPYGADENLYDGEFIYDGTINYGARRRLELDIYIDGNVLWAHILTDGHYTFPLDINNNALAVSIDV